MAKEVSQAQAREALWRAGILRFLLDSNQQSLYDEFYKCKSRRFVLNCGRRVGKSFLLCVLALEHALRKTGATIIYCAPTKQQAKEIVKKIFPQILEGCPEDIRPEWFAQDRSFEFKNGASIKFGALDAGRSDSLRGSDCHLAIVDEAGFSPSHYVEEMVEGVLRPMCLLTKAKICIASTPAKTPRHKFEQYYVKALEEGSGFHRTIYDNPRLSPEDIAEEIKAAGGEETTYWQREYMARFVIDEDIIAFPEFSQERQEQLVKAMERPPYYDAYTSIDIGIKDATACVFLYYDFRRAAVVIEDESLLHGIREVRSDIIADVIKSKEKSLWGDKKPYFRINDYDIGSQLLVNELTAHHDLQFTTGEKDGMEAGVNELRLLIKNNLLFINPRCSNLIAQIAACVWDSKREKFDRIDGYYHFDLVAALILAVRNIRRQHNPYPADRYDSNHQFFYSQPYAKSANAKLLESLFKIKKPE
jgi:hypothetical protein